ncbi:hypothetical protein DFQ11_101861 [Winogradskyella epiphytica]|uniref:Uncharacterized protein n=1 Tax=Winogradskyella epiphytica TaxID=262005 RepID=A0A2V4X0K0_9FLAO|nr:hypothetical protein [Winogradskyella epiphytica]PYE83426.1 hypothetical protein DFQ11_101861 [Winogradskyella epiphytica]GGW58082.1 hypothetical protein GCM10008085_07190 [Winogradskyella epiphytica]
MKNSSDKILPCAIFGHNYVRSKTNIDQTAELTCSHCDVVVITDQQGNFENHTISNSQIKDTLQEFYRLNRRIPKLKVSI